MGNKSSKKKGSDGTSGGDSRASQPGETWDAGSIDDNPDDEVEAHYEPVLVAPGVQLIAKRDGRTSALVNESIEVCYRKWVSDRIQSAIAQNICTFVYTDRVLSEQKWAQCQTCIASGKFSATDEGVCAVCRITCHQGHVFGPEKTVQNICACGENNCASMQKAKVRDVFEDHRTSLKKDIVAFKRATGIKIRENEPPVIEKKDDDESPSESEEKDETKFPISSSFSQPHDHMLPSLVLETKKSSSRSAPTSPAHKPGIVAPFTPGKGRNTVPRSISNIEGPTSARTPTIKPPPESPGLSRSRTSSAGTRSGGPLRPSRSFGT